MPAPIRTGTSSTAPFVKISPLTAARFNWLLGGARHIYQAGVTSLCPLRCAALCCAALRMEQIRAIALTCQRYAASALPPAGHVVNACMIRCFVFLFTSILFLLGFRVDFFFNSTFYCSSKPAKKMQGFLCNRYFSSLSCSGRPPRASRRARVPARYCISFLT